MTISFRLALVGALLVAACSGGGDDMAPTGGVDATLAEGDTAGGGVEPVATDGADGPEGAGVDAALPAAPLAELLGPALALDLDPATDVVEVELVAAEAKLDLLQAAPAVTWYAYNGQVPGPTIVARVGDTVRVKFTNKLSEKTTIHWHGLRIPDAMDGNPRIQDPVEPGESFTYEFVVKEAGTFWYHPHVRSNEQVEKGLYGAFVVREAAPVAVARERLLVLDDVLLSEAGWPPFLTGHGELMHGRTGNRLLVNGLDVPQQAAAKFTDIERWRVINTANARTMRLDVQGEALVRVVGTDGGLLAEPYTLQGPLQVAVGQRYDLEVLHGAVGKVTLRSLVPSLGPDNKVVLKPYPLVEVAVADHPGPATSYNTPFPGFTPPPPRPSNKEVTLTFSGQQDPTSPTGLAWLINGKAWWKDAPLFTFAEGDTVTMTIKNLAGPEHPFHLHGQFFEVLTLNGADAAEPGLKDTVLVPGMSTVAIRAWMDNPGRWMAHCHILEHAEQGMMSEIFVEAGE